MDRPFVARHHLEVGGLACGHLSAAVRRASRIPRSGPSDVCPNAPPVPLVSAGGQPKVPTRGKRTRRPQHLIPPSGITVRRALGASDWRRSSCPRRLVPRCPTFPAAGISRAMPGRVVPANGHRLATRTQIPAARPEVRLTLRLTSRDWPAGVTEERGSDLGLCGGRCGTRTHDLHGVNVAL